MGEALAKPAYGSPCNGCGYCCRRELCPLGFAMFGTWAGPCPAIEASGEGIVCGLVANPQVYKPARARSRGRQTLSRAALYLIGSGVGCDALADGEQPDPNDRVRFKAAAAAQQRETRRAKIAWGVGDR